MIRSNSDYHSQLIILQINYWFSIHFYNKTTYGFNILVYIKIFLYSMDTLKHENKNSSQIKTKKIKICFDTQNKVNYS